MQELERIRDKLVQEKVDMVVSIIARRCESYNWMMKHLQNYENHIWKDFFKKK